MPPVNLLIKPASSLCNMRCQYCFYADVSEHRSVPSYGVMSEETLEALVWETMAYAEGQCTFAFQGGEPTLAGLPFFERAVALVQKYNTQKLPVHYAIQTNGLLIDDAWAAFFKRNHFLVGLSIDGDAATHNALRPDSHGKGTYNRVVKAADTLKKHGCEYNVLCVVTLPAARHGVRIYNQLKRHRFLQFIPCIDAFEGSDIQLSLTPRAYLQFLQSTFDAYYHDFMRGDYVSVRAFDNYIQILLGRPAENCAMNGRCTCNPVVEGDGSVYPCDFYVLDAWRLGNIHEDSLKDMIFGGRSRAFIADSTQLPQACKECQWFALCKGGCRRDREAPGQDDLGPNRFCQVYQDFFAYSIARMQEIARKVAYMR